MFLPLILERQVKIFWLIFKATATVSEKLFVIAFVKVHILIENSVEDVLRKMFVVINDLQLTIIGDESNKHS